MPLIEKPDGRSSTTDSKLITKRTRRFVFRTSVVVYDESVILLQNGVPRIGSAHPTDLGSRCVSVRADQTDAPLVWDIPAEYTTSFPNPERNQENPIQEPPLISYSHREVAVTMFADRNGKPFVNTAGQLLLNPPTVSETVQVLTIEIQQASFDRERAYQLNNTLNRRRWFDIPALHGRASVSAREGFKNGISFWKVVYHIDILRRPWGPVKIANQGIMVWDAEANDWKLPNDANGIIHGQEVMLNEAGTGVVPKADAAIGKIHWLTFKVQYHSDFNRLIQI